MPAPLRHEARGEVLPRQRRSAGTRCEPEAPASEFPGQPAIHSLALGARIRRLLSRRWARDVGGRKGRCRPRGLRAIGLSVQPPSYGRLSAPPARPKACRIRKRRRTKPPPPRSNAGRLAAALANLALLLSIGLAAALAASAAVTGPDSATRQHADIRRAQTSARKGVESIAPGHTRPDDNQSPRLGSIPPGLAGEGSLFPPDSPPRPRSLR